ncbi:YeeE/YedE family protein [Hoeflea prorocentri]|uniref:YeeE/YedE family protein n=1 Tax=Hoeflea prorocentri TaxID=1922333 RepID=A0A9X3UFN9_9HYPH|nr:YeeE/YedE family protein [Hoeflea prorocentri]MCY6379856.1 YeeE/YedE family protein [Hoeflea prorocentri]MDA5397656.1 YeeE/YedE family protein [Hoeflea prorocentri]
MSSPVAAQQSPYQPTGIVLSAAAAVSLLLLAYYAGSTRLLLAAAIGLFAGVALYHASFGFTGAWRQFVFEKRGAGLRAQILLVLLTSAVAFPLIGSEGMFRQPISGSVAPFGVAAALGAFMFGVGMQFGGGCASGTLFTAGGGNTRMVATLAGFIAGSVIATAHLPYWWSLPSFPAISVVQTYGPLGAFFVTAALLGSLYLYSRQRELKHYGSLERGPRHINLLHGPWPKSWGCIALAFVGIATLLVLSRPWGITSAFTLWGAKLAQAGGADFADWSYWSPRMAWLNQSVFADSTSLMNFGIMIGAFAAACLAGNFAPTLRIPLKDLLIAITGGLMMGYGARLAYGCNIGAYLGGVISGSLHGWGWLVFGFIGSTLGARILIRPAQENNRAKL